MLDSEEVLDRFLEELEFELSKAGRGIQARLHRALGLRNGYIHDMFRRRYVELGKAVAVIDALGLDVLSFFERVLAPVADGVDAFDRESMLIGGPLPPIVERAAKRFRGRTPSLQEEGTGCRASHIYRLQNLAAIIDRDPHEAARQVEAQIASSLEIPAESDAAEPVALGLGYYATACCRSGRPQSAQQALSIGLEIASSYGLRPVIAELARRGVEVLHRRNQNAAALRLASSTLRLYEEVGDAAGHALALIERGLLLERVGRPQAALKPLTAALALLPDDDERSRFTAMWALARITLREEALEDAEHHAAAAADIASSIRSAASGWVYRLQATIALQRGAPDQAEAYLEQARQVFETATEPHGRALVAVEFIRVQCMCRAEAEACETAKRLLPPLLASFGRNRSVTRALDELLKAANEDRIPAEAIDRVVQAVEQDDPEVRWR